MSTLTAEQRRLVPLIGILADRRGRRNLLIPCLTLFGAGGILAATAPTFDVLVAARFVMGFGAAVVLSQWGSSWSLLGGAVGSAVLLMMFVLGPLRR